MSPVGFEPTFPASEQSQTHALDRTATETDKLMSELQKSKLGLVELCSLPS